MGLGWGGEVVVWVAECAVGDGWKAGAGVVHVAGWA